MICDVNHLNIYRQQKQILHDISFTLDAGHITVLSGHNGSGKTILLQSLAGLHPPISPAISWRDDIILSDIGYLPQHAYLLKRTAIDNILFVQKTLKRIDRNAVKQLCQECYINDFSHHHIGQLSGGQRYLVALCMLLAAKPKILLLDEPTAHLDPTYSQLIENIIIQQSNILKVVIATHDHKQIERLGYDHLILENGRLIAHHFI